MNFRSVFINKSSNLRAGWRIAIFLLLQLSLSFGLLGLLRIGLSYVGVSGFPARAMLQAVGYLILLATTFVVLRLVDHRPFPSVGLPFHPRLGVEWIQGFLISFLMISFVFLVEFILGFTHVTWREQNFTVLLSGLLTMLVVFLWFGFGEELLFRGYCFQTLIEGTNKYIAILVMSALFGLAHLGNPNATLLGVLNTILAGVWLSVAYLKTRTLWFPTSMHATWNFFQGYVYSFPVSGMNLEERSLFTLQQSGPDWLTGGAYGPEAGVLATVVLVVATFYIIKSRSIQIGEGTWLLETQSQAAVEPSEGSG